MQVSQTQDHVTHVTISKNKAMDFSFDDSAHLSHILSTALYSNPRLAMIRETLCNMWDAHIDAGKTDIPGKITLQDNVLTIRDFGKGIDPDMIQKIYCVYGGSTKTNDSGVTGGFGLGCKSPWAYVDHFEVSSYFGGYKTIYKASKSSAEVNGKPSFLPIITMPCGDQTGLEVKIEIKPQDESYIEAGIKSVVFNGEINATFNDEQLKTLPLSEAKFGYFITTEPLSIDNQNNSIYVRYGNVIYPLEQHESVKEYLNDAISIMRSIPAQDRYSHRGNYRLVVMAEPDSLSIMPSREGLSMSELTVRTVNKILKEFIDGFSANIRQGYAAPIITSFHEEAIKNIPVMAFLNMRTGYIARANTKEGEYTREARIEDNYSLNRAMLMGSLDSYRYPGMVLNEYKWRINRAIRMGLIDRNLATAFRNQLNGNESYRYSHNGIATKPNWIHRHHFWPIVKKAADRPEINLKHLKVHAEDIFQLKEYGWAKTHRSGLVEYKHYVSFTTSAQLNFLKKLIVIGHNSQDISAARYNEGMEAYHVGGDYLAYVMPRNTKKKDIVVQFFKDMGYEIIDACSVLAKPVVIAADDGTPYRPVPKKQGIPKLSSIKNIIKAPKYESIIAVPTVDRTKEPEAVILIRKGDTHAPLLGRMDSIVLDYILKTYGDVIGIAVTQTQHDKYVEKGAMPLENYLTQKTIEYLLSSKTIKAIYATDPYHPQVKDLVGLHENAAKNLADKAFPILVHPEIQKHYRLHVPVNPLDVQFYALYRHLHQNTYRFNRNYADEIKQIESLFRKVPACKRMAEFMKRLHNNEILNKIYEEDLKEIFAGALAPQGVKLITTFIERF